MKRLGSKLSQIDLQLPESVLNLLRRAASIQGSSLSEFVVASACKAAEQTIANQQLLDLAVADQEQFAHAILNPPPVSSPLKDAAKRYKDLVESE